MTRDEILELIGDPAQFRREQESYQRSIDYAQTHWRELYKRHLNEFVAVYDGEFVAHAPTVKEILTQLEAHGVPSHNTYVTFMAPEDEILILPCH